MEQRAHPRFDADEPVRLKTIGADQSWCLGRVSNISEAGVRVFLDQPIEQGTLVQAEVGDQIFVGSVIYCQLNYVQPDRGRFAVGLHLAEGIVKADLDALLLKWGIGQRWNTTVVETSSKVSRATTV